ncbi:hypothetical protein DY119_06435 [Apilactobacillus micheneri]|nr:hypothetical protein DY119_06435 [Apilactobacillus micheneri]
MNKSKLIFIQIILVIYIFSISSISLHNIFTDIALIPLGIIFLIMEYKSNNKKKVINATIICTLCAAFITIGYMMTLYAQN